MKKKPAPKPRFVDQYDPPRRVRHKSQPTGTGVRVTPGLRKLADTLRRKGPLNTKLAYLAWKTPAGGSEDYFKSRLTLYYHEREGGGPYTTRPEELNPSRLKDAQAFHDLSEAGFALAEANRSYAFPRRTDKMHHRALNAVVMLSYEELAPAAGVEFCDKEVLANELFPKATLQKRNPLRICLNPTAEPSKQLWLEPDDLMGLRYTFTDGKTGRRYFAIEIDRATESFSRTGQGQTSLEDKIDRYLWLFQYLLYKEHWRLSNLRVIFITTGPGRIETCRRYLAGKPHADRFLFMALPEFRENFYAPDQPVAKLYTTYLTPNGTFDIRKA